jgi:ABC-type transport system involved in multi-copper enzyme maturation permease subunit
MDTILTISLNTFREAVRNKILYSLLAFAVLVIVASMAFGALSVHEEVRLTADLGLGGMSLFSVIIAIFVGVNLLYKELERKTIYSLVPKPIHRFQFVLGKYIGMVLTLAVQIAIMTVVLQLVLLVQRAALGDTLYKMVLLILFEVLVVTAVAVLFSSFSTPFLSGLLTLGIFLIGRSVPDIRRAARKMARPVLSPALEIVAGIVPNLRHFYATGADSAGEHISIHGAFPDWPYVLWAGGYAMVFVTITLLFAILLFSRRDFI